MLLATFLLLICYSLCYYSKEEQIKCKQEKTQGCMSVKLRKKILAGGKKSLYLDIFIDGQRHYDFLKLYLLKGNDAKTKAANSEKLILAETIRANRESEIQFAEHDIIPSFKRDADFVEYFQKLGESKGRSALIWKNVLNHLKGFSGGKIQFKHINELWLERFQNYLLKRITRNTASGHFGKVRAALKRAVRDRIIIRNPCDKVENIKLEDTERQFLTFEEIKQLSLIIPEKHAHQQVAKMFLFSCFTGLSFQNLQALTYEQIEGNTVKFFRTKTSTWQYVPLSKTALALIGDTFNCPPLAKVFKTPKDRQCRYILEKWGKQANIKKHLHWHIGRHSFATLNLTQGADLYTVSKLLGHKNIATTQIYARVIDESKRKAVDALPQLEL
jgi:site-specific recombinase XerD|tara:strand:+ start:117 stop:1277 length:1161 start_codon:yes stop_codon:yes gene_type:complete